jgi:hypothetical protein
MVREKDGCTYVFAVRVTEPQSEYSEKLEPEEIEVRFDLNPAFPGNSVIEPGYFAPVNYAYSSYSPDSAGNFAVQADNEHLPVDSGTVIVAGKFGQGENDWYYMLDNGKGGLFLTETEGTRYTGNGGTIDYATGKMIVNFGKKDGRQIAILPGKENFAITWRAAKQHRAIAASNGVFRDIFKRNAVHVYKIGTETGTKSIKEINRAAVKYKSLYTSNAGFLADLISSGSRLYTPAGRAVRFKQAVPGAGTYIIDDSRALQTRRIVKLR